MRVWGSTSLTDSEIEAVLAQYSAGQLGGTPQGTARTNGPSLTVAAMVGDTQLDVIGNRFLCVDATSPGGAWIFLGLTPEDLDRRGVKPPDLSRHYPTFDGQLMGEY